MCQPAPSHRWPRKFRHSGIDRRPCAFGPRAGFCQRHRRRSSRSPEPRDRRRSGRRTAPAGRSPHATCKRRRDASTPLRRQRASRSDRESDAEQRPASFRHPRRDAAVECHDSQDLCGNGARRGEGNHREGHRHSCSSPRLVRALPSTRWRTASAAWSIWSVFNYVIPPEVAGRPATVASSLDSRSARASGGACPPQGHGRSHWPSSAT